MKNRNNKFRVSIRNILYLLFFLFCNICLHAQDCQNFLETINKRPSFPPERKDEYENCLKTLESQFNTLNSEQKNIDKDINTITSELRKNEGLLNRAIQAQDTVNINAYTKKIEDGNKALTEKSDKQNTNKTKISSVKTLLIESYKKFITYCESVNNLNNLVLEYQNKLRVLTQ